MYEKRDSTGESGSESESGSGKERRRADTPNSLKAARVYLSQLLLHLTGSLVKQKRARRVREVGRR